MIKMLGVKESFSMPDASPSPCPCHSHFITMYTLPVGSACQKGQYLIINRDFDPGWVARGTPNIYEITSSPGFSFSDIRADTY